MKSIILILLTALGSSASAAVFGFLPGHDQPQPLSEQQIQDIQTSTFSNESQSGVPTWLGIIVGLDTKRPTVHFIDTEHFKNVKTKFGVHQAYAQSMGIVRSAEDFVAQMYGKPQSRKILPFTLYLPHQAVKSTDERLARWVFQNRRYVYKDSPSSFTASLIKAQQAIRDQWSLVTGRPHFITYSKEGFRRPNRLSQQGLADIEALRLEGFSTLTEEELAEDVGQPIPSISVLNSITQNEAYGYLRLVNDEAELNALTPQHIAIFSQLPDRIPPVAAIVTLESQTPLSHINVLAINRGTLNVAIAESALEISDDLKKRISQYTNQLVKMRVGENRIEIEPTDAESAQKFWLVQRQSAGQVNIPEAKVTSGLTIVKPNESHTANEIGAKAANYGRMERLLGNDLVEPGYAIGFSLYRSIITKGGALSIEAQMIQPLVKNMKAGSLSPEQVEAQLVQIRKAIQSSQIPIETLESLNQLVNTEYSDVDKIRFRSSTNCEDLPGFNGAGLYLSEGIKTKHLKQMFDSKESLKKVHEDLLLVISSLWLSRAFWEREYFSIDHLKAAMAIQINPSFSDEFANGVVVAGPKNETFEYWVNSQIGESSVTNPENGEIAESLKAIYSARTEADLLKEIEVERPFVQGFSNIDPVFVNPKDKTMLDERLSLFVSLLHYTRVLSEGLSTNGLPMGIDIEFKIMKQDQGLKLYFKQARPIRLTND